MILIFITGLAFLFLATSTGFLLTRTFISNHHSTHGFFSSLLIGTCAITVYLNVLSFFLPSNFLLLVPVFILSVAVAFKTSLIQDFKKASNHNFEILFGKNNWIVTSAFLTVIVLYSLVPPYNADSSGYHFLSILWNEKYRVVPGLANLFPQFGYNSSFFVLSATFSFTDIFHQSIYSINIVLIISFFLWMLKKSFIHNDATRVLIWFFLLISLRQFPINLASPSADALASIIVFYILFRLAEIDQEIWNKNEWLPLIVLACFSLIIKLSTLPILMIGVVPLFIYRKNIRAVLLPYVKILPILFLIIVPWLIRNVIISGYLVFPFPSIDIFSVDWKVPLNIAVAEKLHISHVARMVGTDFTYVDQLSIATWFPTWIVNFWGDDHINAILVIAALLSVVSLFFKKFLKGRYFVSWLLAFAGIWFWMCTSPDIRFGYHYLLPCIFFPLLSIAENFKWKQRGFLNNAATILVCIICLYHGFCAIKRLSPYRIVDYVYRPLRSPEYYKNNDLKTFRYVTLSNNTKLFIHDTAHHSINAPLPSCSPYRTGITIRGDKLQDGFKTEQ